MNRILTRALCVGAGLLAFAVAAQDRDNGPVSQRVELGAALRYPFAVYASRAMSEDMRGVRQAIIVLHGLQRNGDAYFLAGKRLLEASGANIQQTLLTAPEFYATPDLTNHQLDGIPVWTAQGWIAGEDSVEGSRTLSSLDVLDDMVMRLADRKLFPALARIVVVGHSGGAQIAQRYAVLNDIDKKVRASGIALSYVIANPSSYLYFTDERPDGKSFARYNTVWCPNYNDYRYGLDNIVRYARDANGPELFRRYANRDVTYLLGSQDVDPRHPVLDKTCGAEAEGANRNERGRAYIRYERYLAGASVPLKHRAFEVIGVGHDQERMLGSKCGVEQIFGVRTDSNAAAQCKPIVP